MKFKSIKKVNELVLEGVTFQAEKLDGQLSSVILTDSKGNVVKGKPLDATIQGWDKARWLRALEAKKQAELAIAKAETK